MGQDRTRTAGLQRSSAPGEVGSPPATFALVRTTLTLDDDVAAALAQRRAERGTGLRREVNELLRAGLSAIGASAERAGEHYELPTFDPGRPLIADDRMLKELLEEQDAARALRSP